MLKLYQIKERNWLDRHGEWKSIENAYRKQYISIEDQNLYFHWKCKFRNPNSNDDDGNTLVYAIFVHTYTLIVRNLTIGKYMNIMLSFNHIIRIFIGGNNN